MKTITLLILLTSGYWQTEQVSESECRHILELAEDTFEHGGLFGYTLGDKSEFVDLVSCGGEVVSSPSYKVADGEGAGS